MLSQRSYPLQTSSQHTSLSVITTMCMSPPSVNDDQLRQYQPSYRKVLILYKCINFVLVQTATLEGADFRVTSDNPFRYE